MWYGLKEHQVRELVRKARTRLGFGSFISIVENIPDYRLMTNTKQPFLHCYASFPYPKDPNSTMKMLIYANPTLLGILHGTVDICVDATFYLCTPSLSPCYQCLIVMVYDNHTSSYVPVVYALTTHKNTSLYCQVFFLLKVITQGKMVVRTYMSDFERAEMSQLAIHFPEATHVGYLFHLKQAWFNYLKDKLGLGHQTMSLRPATKVGGLVS